SRWRITNGPRSCVNALMGKRDNWMLRLRGAGSRWSEERRCFAWCGHPQQTVFFIIWAAPAFCCAAFRSMPRGCESACQAANPRGIGFAPRLRSFQLNYLVKHLSRKAISTMPEIANWTPFAFVIDSFLVWATDYAACHYDR